MSKKTSGTATRRRAIARGLPDPNEILRASLITRYTTCGKAGCKCMRGDKHGPSYTLSVTGNQGRTRQLYVRQGDVDDVQRMIDNYNRLWRGLVEISDINFELLRAKRTPRPGNTGGRRRGKP
jgi:hypothetical protein